MISQAWAHGSGVGVEAIGAYSPLILLLGFVILGLFMVFIGRRNKKKDKGEGDGGD
ncbi:MAG: LPXTG cell wall anchor domain-containing protein [Rhodospirillales bacterium]|nr:LPXTG cell wall anchor domain-containing protein [Rhodospirillales bacterium]